MPLNPTLKPTSLLNRATCQTSLAKTCYSSFVDLGYPGLGVPGYGCFMAESNLVELAQSGDATAIATLMNTSLQTIGVRARAALREGNLHILLESDQTLTPQSCIEFICNGFSRLGVALSSAVIYGRIVGERSPSWVQQICFNPFVLAPDAPLEAEPGTFFQRLPAWNPSFNRDKLFDLLLLLSAPLLVLVCSSTIWHRYLSPSLPGATSYTQATTIAQSPALNYRKATRSMPLKQVISGGLSPTSIAYGADLFFVQNGRYRHSISVYDRTFQRVRTLSNPVDSHPGSQLEAPVQATVTPDGRNLWVANQQSSGAGFNAATDRCHPSQDHRSNRLYRVSTKTFAIEGVVQAGASTNALAADAAGRWLLASNECSWDVSVVDTQKQQEIRRIQVGAYPRGIAINPRSHTAYVATMGSDSIAVIGLKDFSVRWLRSIGRSPSQLQLDSSGTYLYASLRGEGRVAKIDLATQTLISTVATGDAPGSLTLSSDGQTIYVANYESNTISKIRARDMQVLDTVPVHPGPIGLTYDPKTHQVWVACASGSVLVFQD